MSSRFMTIVSCLIAFYMPIAAEQVNEPIPKKEEPKEEVVTTSHSIQINGVELPYKVTVGTQLLTDDKNIPKATLFYTAYTKDNVSDLKNRPITFCFNGGPGSSSVWLHLGVFGPRRVDIDNEGKVARQPYHLVDNPHTLLGITDLVFIDPVSTGYSRTVHGEDAKQFHGVEKDIQSIAQFIRLYVTRNERWESPKFLAGESYGTTRAAGLALDLHDNHHMYLDGILLISCALNFQTLKFTTGNDLPYILFLPTYTATAAYHNKLVPELQRDLQKTLSEVEQFASGEYTIALMQGDRLDVEQRKSIIEKLAKYTGLSQDYIDRANLRLNIYRFAKELLRDERRTVGRFDSRLKGIDADLCSSTFEYDPSLDNIIGLFTATFNDYVRAELKWKSDEEYKILTDVMPWDYGTATNQFLDVTDDLREVLNKTPDMEVFMGSGLYDLATPYYTADYTYTHLGLDPILREHVVSKTYDGGHMMYLYYPSLVKLNDDVTHFMQKRLSKHE